MSVSELLSRLDALGVTLSSDAGSLRYSAPKGVLSPALREQLVQYKVQLLDRLAPDRSGEAAPVGIEPDAGGNFAMSALQQAYWIGEKGFYGTACVPYLYSEYGLPTVDVARLGHAVDRLTQRHAALRLQANDEGTQRFAEHRPYGIQVLDWRQLPGAEATAAVEAHRASVERRLSQCAGDFPFEFTVMRTAGRDIVAFAFRLAVVDGVSFNLLLEQLVSLYEDRPLPAPQATCSYRDYIRYLEDRRASEAYRRAEAYWQRRVPRLAGPPQLPFLDLAEPDDAPVEFERLSGRLPAASWQRLRSLAQRHGMPINSVLCAVYCDVLARWSASPEFTLNILLSDRPASPAGMAGLVGNCSTTMLLAVSHRAPAFRQRVEALRAQLFEDMEHACVAGVDLIRQLQAAQGASSRPPMPVVFTSGIGLASGLKGFVIREEGWTHLHSHLKTPQVWLDHQVFEDEGDLVFNWDCVPHAFPDGLVRTMFDSYVQWLNQLAAGETAWEQAGQVPVPVSQLALRQAFNARHAPLPRSRLHQGFVDMARRWPDKVALIDEQGPLSYAALYRMAGGICEALAAVAPWQGNQVVGVHAPKGRRQIAAVLALLMSGNTYLPLDAKLPQQRLKDILAHSGARAWLAERSGLARLAEPVELPTVVLDDVAPADASWPGPRAPAAPALTERAYIIYTSGSTGQPKGVVINHLAAMNTIEDMVRRFGLAPEDVVLGLSALNFDLSVYDIFATFSQGAALLLPPEQPAPDPAAWVQLMRRHPVTVWNSVPALMEVTLEHLGDEGRPVLDSLRLILLSGDWIPPKLARALKSTYPGAQLIGLGGATEASVWSNFHRIAEPLPGWRSIPYGTPLSNQSMHVLDVNMEDCPDWASGELYIGGVGLADEYLNAPDKTAASFVFHPKSGERLYKTGDLARVRDGMIEFLGRKDFQVKLRGYRIELGEIEARLQEIDGVDAGVALLDGRESSAQRLVAFYSTHSRLPLDEGRVMTHLRRHLPHYMVPSRVAFIEQIPLSANAKVDRSRLIECLPKAPADALASEQPRTDSERRLADIWKALLGLQHVDRHTNFFQVGGNSLQLVRLANRLRQELGVTVALTALFQQQTLHEQATLVEQGGQQRHGVLVQLTQGAQDAEQLFLIHPVGGHVLCYQALAGLLPEFSVHGLQASFGPREEYPSTLEEMASRYADAVARQAAGRRVHLGGWSMGAVLALSVARELERRCVELAPLLLIDPWARDASVPATAWTTATMVRGFLNDVLREQTALPDVAEAEDRLGYLVRCEDHLRQAGRPLPLNRQELVQLFDLYCRNSSLLREHEPVRPATPLFMVRALQARTGFTGLQPLWQHPTQGAGSFEPAAAGIEVQATHWTVMEREQLGHVLRQWRACLSSACPSE